MGPYRDTVAHLHDELQRLDIRLRKYLETYWTETERSIEEYQGLYVADETVEGLLEQPRAESDGKRRNESEDEASLQTRLDELTATIRRRERRPPRSDSELRLPALAERFELSQRERDILLVALAPDLDRKYGTVYAYLQDDVHQTRPTTDFLLRVLAETPRARLEEQSAFAPGAPLRSAGLIELTPSESPRARQTVRLSERVLDYLLGSDAVDPSLSSVLERYEPSLEASQIASTTLTRVQESGILARMRSDDARPMLAYIYGPGGVGKQAVVELVATEASAPVLTLQADVLLDELDEWLQQALYREIRLQDAVLWVRATDRVSAGSDEQLRHSLIELLDGLDTHVLLTSTDPPEPNAHLRVVEHEFVVIDVPKPDYERRQWLWEQASDLPDTLDPAELAATFDFSPGQIADALQTARHLAGGEPITTDHVVRACRAQSSSRLSNHAQLIEPKFTWDDIELPPDHLAHLREVAARIKQSGRVYDTWGFGEKFTLGGGLNVLFAGPSGTGKTMAADVIANDAGIDLYKIDISQVVSKYIGETERNLGQIFDEATATDAILLFDEADALFGKRSEVKDSHDRYANIEVNYLLQRIEEHDGTVILTSNFKQNIDEAFLRRLHLTIDFPRPDERSRAAIWSAIFPPATPVGDLDIPFLASLELTGGNIKNVALTAAFMAATDGEIVEMRHVVPALRREFQKTGQLLRPEEFGRYQPLLQ